MVTLNQLRRFTNDDIPAGWMTWYGYRMTLTEETVRKTASLLRDRYRPYGASLIAIDHGWEYRDYLGEWAANDRFPSGMRTLAAEIEAMGLIPGIWIAPSSICAGTPTAEEHSAWLAGRLTSREPFPHWEWYMCLPPPVDCYILDPTVSEAREWLIAIFRQLRSDGYRFFKADFIGNWPTFEASFKGESTPRGQPILREGMSAVREGIGSDGHLLGCSGPTNMCLGLVDSMRTELDVGNLNSPFEHRKRTSRGIAARWYQHKKFWINDPDCLVLSDGEHRKNGAFVTRDQFERTLAQNYEEAKVRAAVVALSGGSLFSGDDLLHLDPEREALLLQCLPIYGEAARPIDLFETDSPRIWDLRVQTNWDDWHVVGLFNWDDTKRVIPVEFERLGLTDECDYRLFDFWRERDLGVARRSALLELDGHSVRVIRISRSRPHPWILSSSMHLTQGGVELAWVRWDGTVLAGHARRAVGAQGRLFVSAPNGWRPSDAHISVEDRGDGVWQVDFQFPEAEFDWDIPFVRQQS